MIPKTCISVSDGFRYALEACFGCLRRSLVVSKVLATPMVPAAKFEGMKVRYIH